MTDSPTPPRVRPRDIADLLAWAASLTQAGPATPAAQAAYLAAKADLLTRLAAQHTHDDPDHAQRAHRLAAHARFAAQQATNHPHPPIRSSDD
jgi:hypothetical protein